jgi:glutathione synthase
MRIAFVADPLDSLDPSIDTTVGLMHAQDRGIEVWATEVGRLEAVNGRARALARPVRLAPSRPVGGHLWAAPTPWATTGEPGHVWLDDMTAVFMRTEPPLDEAYTTATLVLDLVDPARTALVNDPRAVGHLLLGTGRGAVVDRGRPRTGGAGLGGRAPVHPEPGTRTLVRDAGRPVRPQSGS